VDKLFGQDGSDILLVTDNDPNDLADGGVNGGADNCRGDMGDTIKNC